MKDKNPKVPKKHYFPIPKNFTKFNDAEIDEYASQLHGQILEALGESEMNPDHIAIVGSSFVGLIEGEERITTIANFMNSRLVAGKLKCKTS